MDIPQEKMSLHTVQITQYKVATSYLVASSLNSFQNTQNPFVIILVIFEFLRIKSIPEGQSCFEIIKLYTVLR